MVAHRRFAPDPRAAPPRRGALAAVVEGAALSGQDAEPIEARRVLVLGRPGAGKRTQAAALARHLHLPHLSSGELLRALARGDTAAALRARELLEVGASFPDADVIAVVGDAISTIGRNGFVLDGFPRDLRQATALADEIAPHPIDLVFVLEVRAEVALARLRRHGACPSCGQPAIPGWSGHTVICEACGAVFTPPDGGSATAAVHGPPAAPDDQLLGVWLASHARVVHVDANVPPEVVAMQIRSRVRQPTPDAPTRAGA